MRNKLNKLKDLEAIRGTTTWDYKFPFNNTLHITRIKTSNVLHFFPTIFSGIQHFPIFAFFAFVNRNELIRQADSEPFVLMKFTGSEGK